MSRMLALGAMLALASCSTDPPSFNSYAIQSSATGQNGAAPAPFDPRKAAKASDALALNYAESVAAVFRAKATGSRYTREASDTAYAGISGFTAAAGSIGYSASGLAALGLSGTGIVQLQHIFDAKGRANAYGDAAARIQAAIFDFRSYNLNNIDETNLSPNGLTLAKIVQTNIDMVDKVLNGHLPTAEDLTQATEPMKKEGATPQNTGTTPVNNISPNNTRLQAAAAMTLNRTVVLPPEQIQQLVDLRKREQVRRVSNQEMTNYLTALMTANVDPKVWSKIVGDAGLAGKVTPAGTPAVLDGDAINAYFQTTTSDSDRLALLIAAKSAASSLPQPNPAKQN